MMRSTPLVQPSNNPASTATPDALLSDLVGRATAVMGLIAVGVIHFAQVVPTTEQTPWLGAAFVGLSAATLVLASFLLTGGSRQLWWAVVATNALAIGGYAFTRTFSSFLDNVDVGNWSEMLGVAALSLEGILVFLGLHALRAPRKPAAKEARNGARPQIAMVLPESARRSGYADVSRAFARELARR